MDKKIVFDFMNKDVLSSHVEVDLESGTATCINYTKIFHHQAFSRKDITVDAVRQLFRSRCFDENRPDKEELLRSIGLMQYNPYDIVRETHGTMTSDDNWIRFEGEKLQYADVCCGARRKWL